MSSEDENIIIVSHDGTLSVFYAIWLGFNIKMLENFNLSGCISGVSFLREDLDKNHIIVRLNDLSYIR